MQDGKHVILYVDDDQDFLDSMRVLLEANGYKMLEAGSGEERLVVEEHAHVGLERQRVGAALPADGRDGGGPERVEATVTQVLVEGRDDAHVGAARHVA